MLTNNQKLNRRRLVDVLYKSNTAHLGSCISSIDIIDAIYEIKDKKEKFILSNGHAGAALYIILEKNGLLKNPDVQNLGIHPEKDKCKNIDVSTGSLGQGLPIAVGMALANKYKKVYCLISDGECAEGSIWESFRLIQELNIHNLVIVVSFNGWAGYGPIDEKNLKSRIMGFGFESVEVDGHNIKNLKKVLKKDYENITIIWAKTSSEQLPFLRGLDAHYYAMNEGDYKLAMEILK